MLRVFQNRSLPKGLDKLSELALDLRWTWSHEGDQFWHSVNPKIWAKTKNPWLMLQSISRDELQKLARNPIFIEELNRLIAARDEHFGKPSWFKENNLEGKLGTVAYFSMEFGIGEALPLYAGGLGILAGDYLKTACDLEVPIVGMGLLYQEGYFRQAFDENNWQIEAYPYNDPISLPISPVMAASGWLRVSLELPGRTLWLRVWQVRVGRVMLYLLDSNDPLNNPFDRGITNKLYPERPEIRLMQEMILGIGGWRTLKALNISAEVCHLNEGHAAFVVLERARDFMQQNGEPFSVALCATRAGNVFTTHTPVEAGFDMFAPGLVSRYLGDYSKMAGIPIEQVLALGRKDPTNQSEPLNMAYLAMRGSIKVNGVSRLHGKVSRHVFQPLYSRWPEDEVPVQHITNGVHMPSWDSQFADKLWTQACGKERWLHTLEHITKAIQSVSDEDLWSLRTRQSDSLVNYVRQRLAYQLKEYGADPLRIKEAQSVLDTGTLTIGFARRFTAYKRPNLLLTDPERLTAIITNPARPVQLVVAGKAHPADDEGKHLVQQFVNFAERAEVRQRVVFLEDYDIDVAQELVQGVDVWLNTPRRPWEASGTSGMKALVNGGLNVSELDGWWAEAYAPEFGWTIGDGQEHSEPSWDEVEARQLYNLLESEIAREFYNRDSRGIPLGWIARMRACMSRLAANFSANRMVREYVERVYIPTAQLFRERSKDSGRLAKEIYAWQTEVERHWSGIRFRQSKVSRENNQWQFETSIYLGRLTPEFVKVELYAEPLSQEEQVHLLMKRDETPGQSGSYVYQAEVSASRPSEDYTVRIIPSNASVVIPLEDSHILWQK